MKHNIVIMDCNRNGLACIRSLALAGHDITAIDHRRLSPGIYTRYKKNLHLIPSPQSDENAFIASVKRIGDSLSGADKPLLLPVNDTYVRTLAAHWDELKSVYEPLFEINTQTLDTVTNKIEFSKFCGLHDIPRPAEYTAAEVLEGKASFPIIFKPDERNTIENMRNNVFKVKIANGQEEATQFIEFLREKNIEVIIQQLIPGGDDELYTAGVSALNGKLLGCFTGRKVRQFPPTAGQAAWAEALECPKIIDYAKKIVEKSKFTGLSQIEFKHHNGEYYVIEMNPRSWSWHGLAKPAGVDLPKILVDAFDGIEPSEIPQVNVKNKIYWHYFLEDFYYHFILNRNLSIAQLFSSWRKASSHAFYDSKDIMPAIAHLCIQYPIRLIKWVVGFQDRLSRINLNEEDSRPAKGTDQT